MTLFFWPTGCKQAWWKFRQGKHHAKVFIDVFVLWLWWFGWTPLKPSIKKECMKMPPCEISSNFNCNKPETFHCTSESSWTRAKNNMILIPRRLKCGQAVLSREWITGLGEKWLVQDVLLSIETMLFPWVISTRNLPVLTFSMAYEWHHWVIWLF